MKKLFVFALASLLALSACDKKDDAATKDAKADNAAEAKPEEAKVLTPQEMADSVEFTKDGLKALFKDNPLTAEEYEAFILSFGKCEFQETESGFYNYKDCPAKQLYLSGDVPGIKPSIQYSVLTKLLKHENPIVRDKAYDDLLLKEDNIKEIMDIFKEEKDPHIILSFFVRLSASSQIVNPEVAPFVKSKVKDGGDNYREQFLFNVKTKSAKTDPEFVAIVDDMCKNDPNEDIKKIACSSLPKFQEE